MTFHVSNKDTDNLIKPSVEQFLKQITVKTKEDAKNDDNTKLKPSEPTDILKSFNILQNLIKNKYKQSSKEHSVEDYTVAALKFMYENKTL